MELNISLIGFLIFIVVVGFVVALVILMRKIFSEKEEIMNGDILLVLSSEFTDGYATGIIKSIRKKNGWLKIQMKPRDINYLEAKNNKNFKLEEQTVLLKEKNLIPLNNSKHRNIYLGIPEDIMRLPPLPQEIISGLREYINKVNHEDDEDFINKTAKENLMDFDLKDRGLMTAKDLVMLQEDFLKDKLKKETELRGEKPDER